MKYTKLEKHDTNSLLIDYLLNDQIVQNIVLIYIATKKWISMHVNKEYLGDLVVAFIMAVMIIIMFLFVGEWKLRSIM